MSLSICELVAIQLEAPIINEFKVHSTLPFLKNTKFSGRVVILQDLSHFFLPSQLDKAVVTERMVVVLHGMGRVGKTQIALRFAHMHAESYESIFWVDAKNKGTMETSCLHIFDRLIVHYAKKYQGFIPSDRYEQISIVLGVPGGILSTGTLVKNVESWEVVRQWFEKEENTKWLLLVDNNDDQDAVRISGYLPACEWGCILITSRNCSSRQYGKPFPVLLRGKEDGLKLLLTGAVKEAEDLPEEGQSDCLF